MEQTCLIFNREFFPLKQNYLRIIPLIEEQITKEHINDQFFQDILKKYNTKQTSEIIYEYLLKMIDFLDKGHIGFLTGDIHPMTFNILERELNKVDTNDPQIIYENLKQSIFNVGNMYKLPLNGIKTPHMENQLNLFERQLILEEESNNIAVEKFQEVFESLCSMSKAHNLRVAQQCIVDWFPDLYKAIQREQLQILANKERQSMLGQITTIQSEKLAMIGLQELMKEIINQAINFKKDKSSQYLDQNQIKASALASRIGDQINNQIIFENEQKKIKDQLQEDINKIVQEAEDAKLKETQTDEEKNKLKQKEQFYESKLKQKKFILNKEEKLVQDIKNKRTYQKFQSSLPKESQIQIGSYILQIMINTIKYKNANNFLIPLMVQTIQQRGKSKKAASLLNINFIFLQDFIQSLTKNSDLYMHLDRSLPMIYPPSNWKDVQIGGYYLRPTLLLRLAESKKQQEVAKSADLTNLFQVIDFIQSTPWRINQKVLDVAIQIWDQGGGLATIPKKNYDKSFTYEYQLKDCKSNEEKYKLLKKLQQQRDQYSLKCDFSLKLSVATSFSRCEKFYYPHNVDFRGRLYPIPPHLNHIGADLSRGLLEFSEGKPLGDGFRWLKIHLANKMGKDKLRMQERINYVDENHEMILKCAEKPMEYRNWIEFEDAWQSLAAMIDYANAYNSPNPSEYISHIHIHQDGSCNGLQHYAALGRDIEGATQVNLANTEKPGDVYTYVANMVARKVQEDSDDSMSENQQLAIRLRDQVKRKIVKQTVMTSVYGVTFIGAREQIHRQLKDKQIIDDDESLQYQASLYLAKITLDAIKDLFNGAHQIKQWLIACAKLISDQGEPVSWITPLGLPVIQPYRVEGKYDHVQTIMNTVSLKKSQEDLPVNKNKQRSAFPPNFIHSLDSTHLMYTALECQKENITFAAVHDSYWTHACHVDRISQVLRNQFVRLHSQPLLEELLESFMRRYPKLIFPELPKRGQFDLENVKNSLYFFA